MNYPKEFIKSDGRKLRAGGPRDLQRRQKTVQTQDLDISGLKEQFDDLRKDIQKVQPPPEGVFSPEQVDEEVRKAVEQAVAETMLSSKKTNQDNNQNTEQNIQKYKLQIVELQKNKDDLIKSQNSIIDDNNKLKEQIKKLDATLKEVDKLERDIAILEQKLVGKEELIETLSANVNASVKEIIDPDRPKMEQRFIDPLEKDFGKGLESHIDITDVTASEKDNMVEKVDKLKNLLGKLPIGNN